MDYVAILGRQHELGLAELESLYGPGALMPINKHACFVNEEVDFDRLGSSVKFARYIETLASHTVDEAIHAALPYILDERKHRQGKLQLGISVYGTRVSPNSLNRTALDLKKKLRSKGLSLRLIPNKTQELNAAQILRNKLTKENGFELNVIVEGKRIHLAQTLAVQDIDEYARRDREKPVRDPLVGMLPPKLAQTLINMANTQHGDTLLDPFCGTGTILIEAYAMGIDTHGSDISPDMVDATRVNMEWFSGGKLKPIYDVELADATNHQWQQPIDAIACETYLGPALRTLPEAKVLDRIVEEVNDIHEKFLINLAAQLKSGARIALAVPSWHKKGKFIDLPILDDLEKLGYNPVSFVFAKGELVYHRPNQVVGRRILNLVRK
jgi:tRNA G10  N-methylase Trm11